MKRAIAIFCSVAVASSLVLTGCGGKQDDYSQIMSEEVTGEITVSCYDSMRYKTFLEQAAKDFEGKYPGTKVTVESFSAMPEIKTQEDGEGKTIAMITMDEDSQAEDDYINKINTELMSGAGADVLAMDVLPYYQYAETGTLEDLNHYIQADADFSMADYQENVLKATQYNDGQYIIPLDYQYDYFAYDSSLFGEGEEAPLQGSDTFTYQELIDIAQKPFENNNGNNKMFGLTADVNQRVNMFSALFELDYKSYIDIETKTTALDDGRFAKLLETVRQYGEEGYIKQAGNTDGEFSREAFEKEMNERYFYKTKNSFTLFQYFNRGNGTGNTMMSFGGASSGNEENDEIIGLPTGSEGEIAFTYSQAYGLNANSANKRTAWEFIKFLLSEETQTSAQLSITGLPVNNSAREAKANMMVTGDLGPRVFAGGLAPALRAGGAAGNGGPMAGPEGENGGDVPMAGPEGENSGDVPMPGSEGENGASDQTAGNDEENGGDKTLTAAQQKTLDDYLSASEKFSDMLNAYVIQDTKIDAMIQTEVKNFFSGEKTADEVAKTLQSKVELYLNE